MLFNFISSLLLFVAIFGPTPDHRDVAPSLRSRRWYAVDWPSRDLALRAHPIALSREARRSGATTKPTTNRAFVSVLLCFLIYSGVATPTQEVLWPLPPHTPHSLTPTIPFPYFSFALPPPIGTAFSAYVLPPFLCFFSVRRAETSPLRVSHHVPIRLDWR